MTLQNFVPFDFNEGAAYASITKNGITFNKAVMSKLNFPRFVQLLINSQDHKIAIQSCDCETPRAIQYYKANDNKAVSVRWNGKDLLNTLCEMMDWNLNEASYRIDGKHLRDEHAILFDLSQAKNLDAL